MEIDKVFKQIGEKIHYCISNGGWLTVLVFAFIAILFAIIGYYGTVGFNWKMFIFAELPLYAFCIWALSKVFKLIKNNPDTFKL